jgi:acyl-CoA thioesterase
MNNQSLSQLREKIWNHLSRDEYAKYLGIEVLEWGDGRAVAELNVRDYMVNAHGSVHGAVIFALADTVFAIACNSYGKTAVALSMNIGFLAPGWPGERLKATAEEVKVGGKTGWYRIIVENENGLVAQLDALAYRKNQSFIDE